MVFGRGCHWTRPHRTRRELLGALEKVRKEPRWLEVAA
ncbi:hypothetical protein SMSKK35_4398 [Stenotrophomonas maltophilia SKK35]|nr:hypothetical protein SMSKK35_4398 [Stenotrophomonas maltophilia SKK35]